MAAPEPASVSAPGNVIAWPARTGFGLGSPAQASAVVTTTGLIPYVPAA